MGSDLDDAQPLVANEISIHAPRMGSDHKCSMCSSLHRISIHAPRMGSDSCRSIPSTRPRHFNPRFPHGERRLRHALVCDIREFQSTLPAWGATFCQPIYEAWLTISIHAPRVGSDRRLLLPTRRCAFQSTLPAGGATSRQELMRKPKNFNPRSPRGERHRSPILHAGSRNFNPRSPRGERPRTPDDTRRRRSDFNPRSPRGERRVPLPGLDA